MRVGDLIMIGESLYIIVHKYWNCIDQCWAGRVCRQDDLTLTACLDEDIIIQARRDYIWWTENVLDDNIRNGYIVSNKGGHYEDR